MARKIATLARNVSALAVSVIVVKVVAAVGLLTVTLVGPVTPVRL